MSDFPGQGKKVGLIGVPLGYGAGKMGSELGVNSIRFARVRKQRLDKHIEGLGYEYKDYGNVDVVLPERDAAENEKPKYLKDILASSENMVTSVGQILADGAMPIILGADHAIAI